MRQIVGSVQLGSIEGRFGLLLSLEWSREESEKERERERGREGEGGEEGICMSKQIRKSIFSSARIRGFSHKSSAIDRSATMEMLIGSATSWALF